MESIREFKNVAEIREERAQLRENPVLYRLLGTIIGELDRQVGKSDNASAEDIYKILKKIYDANLSYGSNIPPDIKEEIEYLHQFQKRMITGQKLYKKLEDEFATGNLKVENGMKGAMAWLKETIPGQYDGKEASKIVKHILDNGVGFMEYFFIFE